MAEYPFSKKQLKNAARIYAERRNDALEASLDQEPVQFSPEFQNEIAVIISAADTAIRKRKRIRSRVAAAIVAVIILITAFFSFNTTARAAFVNWIKDFYKEYIVYYFLGDSDKNSLPEITPVWLPEGQELTHTEKAPDHLLLYYENKNGDGFDISCYAINSESELYISDLDDKRDRFTIAVSDYIVDCYVSADDVSDYVWHDEDGKYFFTMNSNLPHEINVKIIEHLTIIVE